MVKEIARVEGAKIEDIVGLILEADRKSGEFIGDVSGLIGKTDRQTIKNVWSFVRKNVKYREDGGRLEVIKSPRAAIVSGVADCKSMAVMAAAIVRKMGFPYFYRVVFYDKNRPGSGHIYVVVDTENGRVILDPVDPVFDRETSYWKKKDYNIGKIVSKDGRFFVLVAVLFLILGK